MSEHVTERIIDFVDGRLPPEESRAVEAHLQLCTDCSEDFALVKQLRSEVVEHALQHLGPERIVEIAAGMGPPTLLEQRHLSHCGDCSAETEWARRQPRLELLVPPSTAPESVRRPERRRSRSWTPRWVWIGAAAATTVAVVLWVSLPRSPVDRLSPSQFRSMARIEPLPVQINRGSAVPGSFEESRLLGLEAYADGDFTTASTRLRLANELRPADDEVLLYLASAELLSGRGESAIPLLVRVVERATVPDLLGEALWILANTQLERGDAEAAIAALDRLVTLGGRHAAEAHSLLDRLR